MKALIPQFDPYALYAYVEISHCPHNYVQLCVPNLKTKLFKIKILTTLN
jgi:hypothetical protein